MSEKTEIRPEFAVHMLNEDASGAGLLLCEAFDGFAVGQSTVI